MTKKKAKEKVDNSHIIEDLTNQIEASTKAQVEKLAWSKEHLVAQLKMASEKYRTVNGYMQARTTLDQVVFGDPDLTPDVLNYNARELARKMSEMAANLATVIDDTAVDEIDDALLDNLLDMDFLDSEFSYAGTARELLIANLLQNVGPSIDDIVQFRTGKQHEIDQLTEELAKYGAPKLEVVD